MAALSFSDSKSVGTTIAKDLQDHRISKLRGNGRDLKRLTGQVHDRNSRPTRPLSFPQRTLTDGEPLPNTANKLWQ
jgi:hypothetical protein